MLDTLYPAKEALAEALAAGLTAAAGGSVSRGQEGNGSY